MQMSGPCRVTQFLVDYYRVGRKMVRRDVTISSLCWYQDISGVAFEQSRIRQSRMVFGITSFLLALNLNWTGESQFPACGTSFFQAILIWDSTDIKQQSLRAWIPHHHLGEMYDNDIKAASPTCLYTVEGYLRDISWPHILDVFSWPGKGQFFWPNGAPLFKASIGVVTVVQRNTNLRELCEPIRVVKLAPVGMNVCLFCVYTLQSETDDLCRRSRPPVSMCHSYSLFSLPQATCQGSLKHGKLVDGFVFDDSLLHVEGMAALTKHIVSNCLNRCRDQLFVSNELLTLLKIMKPISMLYV